MMEPFPFNPAHFRFTIEGNRFIMDCPAGVYDLERVREAVASSGSIFTCQADPSGRFHLWGEREKDNDLHVAVQELFARINGYPRYFEHDFSTFRNSVDPLVSCIILLTRNDIFVKNHLLPSIVKNSHGHAIEITVLYNGFDCNIDPFREFNLLESDFLSVAMAYNKGVRHARGRYIAVFHDDCMLDDNRWIEKATEALEGGAAAVTGEFENNTAKCTPLVMERQAFLDMGGFDENYRGGGEDRDLTYTLLSQDKNIGINIIRAIHFQGISTILVFSREAEKFRQAAAYNALPLRVWRQLKYGYLSVALGKGIGAFIARDMLYFNKKFKSFLFTSEERYLAEEARLTAVFEQHRNSPLLQEDAATIPDILELVRS